MDSLRANQLVVSQKTSGLRRSVTQVHGVLNLIRDQPKVNSDFSNPPQPERRDVTLLQTQGP